jgi:hypothetical protein
MYMQGFFSAGAHRSWAPVPLFMIISKYNKMLNWNFYKFCSQCRIYKNTRIFRVFIFMILLWMIKGEKWVMGGKKLWHLFFFLKPCVYVFCWLFLSHCNFVMFLSETLPLYVIACCIYRLSVVASSLQSWKACSRTWQYLIP